MQVFRCLVSEGKTCVQCLYFFDAIKLGVCFTLKQLKAHLPLSQLCSRHAADAEVLKSFKYVPPTICCHLSMSALVATFLKKISKHVSPLGAQSVMLAILTCFRQNGMNIMAHLPCFFPPDSVLASTHCMQQSGQENPNQRPKPALSIALIV